MLIIFGLPGAGKTYVGKLIEKDFGYYFYDGDLDLPPDMKEAIDCALPVTDEMRDRFFRNIAQSVKRLSITFPRLVISQTFIKEKYRVFMLSQIPQAEFVLVQTDTAIREKRLKERKEFPLDSAYARQMVQNFDSPQIPHRVLTNNIDGKEGLRKQIQKLFSED